MRWPWRRGEDEPVPEDAKGSVEHAAAALRELQDRQPHVDELERWARRESRINGFSERMRRGMGG